MGELEKEMTINGYFDKVVCINLSLRTDRWKFVEEECAKHSLTLERFEAIDMGSWGNNGCTASHGAVLQMIVDNGWKRTLILKDDFQFRFDDSQQQFSNMIGAVPDDWWMLYLGGHYAEKPQGKVSDHVIRMGRMKTTSSYGVTIEAAKAMAPHIQGIGPIDELYGGWHETEKVLYSVATLGHSARRIQRFATIHSGL